jgi:hypothetical protein
MERKFNVTRDRKRRRRIRFNRNKVGFIKDRVKFTICFYEDPAALQEIEFWENLIKDKIVESDKSGKFLSYLLDKDNDYEFVCCIPLDVLIHHNTNGITNIVKNSLYHVTSPKEYIELKQSWHKILIFGKIKKEQLMPLERLMTLYKL